MTGTPQNFDAPPVIDTAETQTIFSPENLQRLMALVAPRLQAGKRTMVYILPASSRFAHMALEPWALHTLYGETFDEILVVIRDRRLLPHGAGIRRLAATVVSFVETTNDKIVKLGHFDAPRMENGPLCLNLQSPQMLLQDLGRHLKAGNPVRHLRLSEDLERDADAFLGDLGVSADDKIVTVHMREGGYLASHRYHSFRVMTPSNYEPAVRHLLQQGRWVFRLGDPQSTTLGIDHPRFIDLPFLKGHEDFMDVVLLARAHFALCCTSGPEGPARALGTPLLMVNAILDANCVLNPRDVLYPRRYVDETTGEPLSYEQILFDGAVDYSLAKEFERARIHPEENTSAEILNAVIEMESRLDGSFVEAPAIDGKFAGINQRYAEHRAATPPTNPAASEPVVTEVAFSLPWSTLSHAYCRAHPTFLAVE
ncbi:MAG: TIGR04372 family glycosyltransferase [Proteobacteria bacterium]|nr:TIGR04372 family glycosyltransferase [Pseudomonadota bacterium]